MFLRKGILNLMSFCYMFAAGSLYVTLVLFFVEENIPESTGFQIVAVFLAILAVSSILCGTLLGRSLKYSTGVALGAVFYASGISLLLFSNHDVQLFGLALCIVGAGLYIPATQVLINRQFVTSVERQKGVQVNYIIKNLGAVLGLLVTTVLPTLHYRTIHFISALLLILATIFFLRRKESLQDDTGETHYFKVFLTVVSVVLLSFIALIYQTHTQKLLILTGLTSLLYIAYLYYQSRNESYIHYMVYVAITAIIYHLVNAAYFVVYGVFIKENMQDFPYPLILLAVDPLIIIIFGLLIVSLFKQKSLDMLQRYKLGSLCLIITMLIPIFGLSFNAEGSISTLWILLSIIFYALAECIFMPAILIQTTELVPMDQHGLFMGFTRGYRGVGFAIFSYLCSKHFIAGGESYSPDVVSYLHMFEVLAICAIGLGVAVFVYPYIKNNGSNKQNTRGGI